MTDNIRHLYVEYAFSVGTTLFSYSSKSCEYFSSSGPCDSNETAVMRKDLLETAWATHAIHPKRLEKLGSNYRFTKQKIE
jgi:hypothetical protein